jgi:hypothetical protein
MSLSENRLYSSGSLSSCVKCEAEALTADIAQRHCFAKICVSEFWEEVAPGLCHFGYYCGCGRSMGDSPHFGVGNSYFSMAFFQSTAGLWEVLHVGDVRFDRRVSISCQK